MIVAGEASGDLHGSRLVASMLAANPHLTFCGIGGPELAKLGVEILYDASKIAVVGFFEVVSHLSNIIAAQKILRRRLVQEPPSLLILVDFPDFNLLLARKAKKYGIPIFYYISPQVWAWRSGRVKTIGRLADRIGVILPFEETFYKDRGVAHVEYVGHPLLDSVGTVQAREEFCAAHGLDSERKLIGILPGSRNREIKALLPEFLAAAELLQSKCRERPIFLIPVAPTIEAAELSESGVADFRSRLEIHLITNNRYDLMAACDAIVAASGTATLEIMLLDTPMVVAYKLAPLTYQLGKLLVKIDYFSLVNLIAGKQVVLELLQHQANREAISAELYRLIYDDRRRQEIFTGYRQSRDKLGERGASEKAAALALLLLAQKA